MHDNTLCYNLWPFLVHYTEISDSPLPAGYEAKERTMMFRRPGKRRALPAAVGDREKSNKRTPRQET